MANKIQAPKGFEDILPADSSKWQAIERIARQTAALYHFDEIRTPVLESTSLFHRGVGEGSDIVRKETFTFEDRGGDSMTMRPEGTAGVVRAMIEHNLLAQEGSRGKVYYIGPNFRYERPQKGRLRAHHQFGAEAFGIADPDQDVECILLQADFYRRCGLENITLYVNSLGDKESKNRYSEAIRNQLLPNASSLSEESQRRLETNPLRILDSKDPRDKQFVGQIVFGLSYLSESSKAHLDRVHELLTKSWLNDAATITISSTLVRGFDYYTETLWEFTAEGLGAQNAIGGGGRYDNLVENLGGRPTPGVGFGSGLERLLIALEAQKVELPDARQGLVWLIYHNDAARAVQWHLLQKLRASGVAADMDHSGRSVKAQLKILSRERVRFTVTVGDAELANATAVVKNVATNEQLTVTMNEVIARVKAE